MSKLSRDGVLKLARLSQLKLSEEEIEKFRVELSEILNYVEKLDSVDTKGLEPTYQVTGLKNVTREDKTHGYGYKVEDILKASPDTKENHYQVKRVL